MKTGLISLAYELNMLFDRETKKRVREILQTQAIPPKYNEGVNKGYYKKMVMRYVIASYFSRDKTVLDCGCCLGWGSYIMSKNAKKVIGIDIQEDHIEFAKSSYGNKENLSFIKGDIINLDKYVRGSFDIVTSMEVIEHLKEKDCANFVQKVHNLLSDGGLFIVSSVFAKDYLTAEKILSASCSHNRHIYTKDEWRDMLRRIGFARTFFLGWKAFSKKGKT